VFVTIGRWYDFGSQEVMGRFIPSVKEANRLFLPNYGERTISFKLGQGCRLRDSNGKDYLDFGSGITVNHLGHCHPLLVAALHDQADRLWHTSNYWLNDKANLIAQLLVQKTFADQVFLCSSGLEANEAALKLARQYGKQIGGENKHKILCFSGAFHGRSLWTLSLSGKEAQRLPFAPLPAGIYRCSFNDVAALEKVMNEEFCAVILELVQGEGGVHLATRDLLQMARELCNRYQALLIFDEIQSGLGRTGKLFAYMHYGIEPDLMTSAKALGGGFPIAALLARKEYGSYLTAGSHGSTYGSNALAAAVAYESVRITDDISLLTEVTRKGEWLMEELRKLKEKKKIFSSIRGLGLLIGASLVGGYSGSQIRRACEEEGLLILLAADGDVLRLAPPLIINDDELQQGMTILTKVIDRL